MNFINFLLSERTLYHWTVIDNKNIRQLIGRELDDPNSFVGHFYGSELNDITSIKDLEVPVF